MEQIASRRFRDSIKRSLGPSWTTKMRCLARNLGFPRWGNLRRVRPFSTCFGWDRGTPIDRYYVDRFFDQHREFITGDVLEIQQSVYTQRYGHHLRTMHSFDIDPRFGATFTCDLAHCEDVLPSQTYDCVLMPCTLSLLREIKPCLRNALRAVKPGGVILANGAGLIPFDGADTDFWHCSPEGWRHLTRSVWPDCEIVVEGHGNCLAVVAANLGLSAEELTAEELDCSDEVLPIVTNVFCRKPSN